MYEPRGGSFKDFGLAKRLMKTRGREGWLCWSLTGRIHRQFRTLEIQWKACLVFMVVSRGQSMSKNGLVERLSFSGEKEEREGEREDKMKKMNFRF